MSERDAQHVVLAIDGGNIKTDVALVAGDGQLLSLIRGGTSSPRSAFRNGVASAYEIGRTGIFVIVCT